MNIKMVRIVKHEEGYKGTWYRAGEEHFVVERKEPRLACIYQSTRITGGIMERDAVKLKGVRVAVLCVFEWIRIKAKAAFKGQL